MKRRTFLLFSVLILFTKSFAKDSSEKDILISVLNHLFPTTNKYSGSINFKAFKYLLFISKHPSFDTDDLKFLIKGAKKLYTKHNDFIQLSTRKKEEALRDFEKTDFGINWLSVLLYYGLEAMLGDPIYGGNKDMKGWKNINHKAPVPMAKIPFGKKYV